MSVAKICHLLGRRVAVVGVVVAIVSCQTKTHQGDELIGGKELVLPKKTEGKSPPRPAYSRGASGVSGSRPPGMESHEDHTPAPSERSATGSGQERMKNESAPDARTKSNVGEKPQKPASPDRVGDGDTEPTEKSAPAMKDKAPKPAKSGEAPKMKTDPASKTGQKGSGAAAAPKKKPINVEVTETLRIVEVDGEDVKISGREGMVVLKGTCGKLSINGSKTRVRCDSAGEVEIKGDDNVVAAESIGKGTISGSRNELTWKRNLNDKEPKIESQGEDNKAHKVN